MGKYTHVGVHPPGRYDGSTDEVIDEVNVIGSGGRYVCSASAGVGNGLSLSRGVGSIVGRLDPFSSVSWMIDKEGCRGVPVPVDPPPSTPSFPAEAVAADPPSFSLPLRLLLSSSWRVSPRNWSMPSPSPGASPLPSSSPLPTVSNRTESPFLRLFLPAIGEVGGDIEDATTAAAMAVGDKLAPRIERPRDKAEEEDREGSSAGPTPSPSPSPLLLSVVAEGTMEEASSKACSSPCSRTTCRCVTLSGTRVRMR